MKRSSTSCSITRARAVFEISNERSDLLHVSLRHAWRPVTKCRRGSNQPTFVSISDDRGISTKSWQRRTSLPGVAIGVGVTAVGGDIMFIESSKSEGKGGMTITGQLGDVMRESAQAALSYVRANAESLGIDSEVFKNADLHIHVPAGATPKDGPSAGVAFDNSADLTADRHTGS